MKEAVGFPAVDQGQAPRGGQGVGVFSLMWMIFPLLEGS